MDAYVSSDWGARRDWDSDPLWHGLQAMRIGPADAGLSFEKRLARENGWAEAHAAEVVQGYRRFLYLTARVREPMTPSVAVDQAWHLHLSYTRHYWDELCGQVLGRALHHQPTDGGPAEADRFRRQYERTLAAYASIFGCPPPVAIWPSAEVRFASRLQCVDRAEVWVVRKTVTDWAGSALLVVTVTSLWATFGDQSWTEMAFGVAYLTMIPLFFVALRRRKRKDGEGADFEWPDFGGDGGCGGGCGG